MGESWTPPSDLSAGDKITENIWDNQVAGNLSFLYAKFTELTFETAATELTIAAGVVTVTQSLHTIDTQSDDPSDDLDTINGLEADGLYIIRAAHTDRTVVVKHGTGNIYTFGEDDVDLDSTEKALLVYSPDGTNALVIGGGGGGTADWANPGTIGSTTPNTGDFTTLSMDVLRLDDSSELTLDVSGEITVTGSFHTVDTYSDAAQDQLDTINGGAEGWIVILTAEHTDREVVIGHGTGNIYLDTGGSVGLDSTGPGVLLVRVGANWYGGSLGRYAGVLHAGALALDGDPGDAEIYVNQDELTIDRGQFGGTVYEMLRLIHNASAVNNVQIDNAAAAASPKVSVRGSDTNIDLRIEGTGTGEPSVPSLKLGDEDIDYLQVKKAEASASLSGSSTDVQVNVPDNALILGAVVSATTAVYVDESPGAWDAAFTGGATSTIVTGAASGAENQKAPVEDGATTAETDVRITPNAGSAFTGGAVKATVFYVQFGDNVAT